MIFTVELEMEALPPYDFEISSEIFGNGDKQIRNYENGKFWQVLAINDKLILATAKSQGNVNKPKITVELKSESEITENDTKKAKNLVNLLFSLDLDLNPFYSIANNDKIMAQLTRKLWGLKTPTTPSVFEALVDSIIEQQISLKVANSLRNKLIKRFGHTLRLEEDLYYSYPTPQRLASVSIAGFRDCGLSMRKAEYIKGVSAIIAEEKLNLEKLKKYENSEHIIAELDKIRGVGVWTAEFTLLRGMQRLDALPADDLGLRRVISRYYCQGRAISSSEVRQVARNWSKWKGLAAYYLVVADMKNIEI
jgi:DNA-3-methyladenine glycosylase II